MNIFVLFQLLQFMVVIHITGILEYGDLVMLIHIGEVGQVVIEVVDDEHNIGHVIELVVINIEQWNVREAIEFM